MVLIPGRNKTRIMFLVVLMTLFCVIAAKKEPDTPSPVMKPSPVPTNNPTDSPTASPTANPTSSPTSIPTESPTSTPTASPTKTPTYSPTVEPTYFPTGAPTSSPIASTPSPTTEHSIASEPTSSPTSHPTILTVVTPTGNPTQTSTAAPTVLQTSPQGGSPSIAPEEPSAQIESVKVPTIGLNVVVSDEDGESDVVGDLESAMIKFVDDILGQHHADYTSASLEVNIIQSQFNGRKLYSGLSIQITGTAFFVGNTPTERDLALEFSTFFSVWGLEDIESYLHDLGLTSSQVVSVAIDDNVIQSPDIDLDSKAGAIVEGGSTGGPNSDDEIPFGILAGLAAGCLVVVMALLALVLVGRRNRKRSGGLAFAPRAADFDEDSDTVVAAVTPPLDSPVSDDNDEEMSMCGVSVDLSLYTTEDSIAQKPAPVVKKYDPKRLDKLIEVARKHSDLSTTSQTPK
eukprot:Nitzschia sp. Nitz4//scaffold6_size259037//21047//22420//NITZ4_001043-RA/size259037-processed-gene-0.1-mRNA-1//1//CDS//3329556800//8718//frame0